MALIIEDGSIVVNANSWATVVEAREWAEARGITLAPATSDGNTAIEAMLVKAGDYLNSLDAKYRGEMVQPLVQTMVWPREGVSLFGQTWPDDEIPERLKRAQCQLCIEQRNGINITSSQSAGVDGAIIRDKTGPLETQWSEAVLLEQGFSVTATMPAVDALIEPLFENVVSGGALSTRRV